MVISWQSFRGALAACWRRVAGVLMSLNDPQWGRGGGKNQGPPDLDELMRNFNQKIGSLFGRKGGGGKPDSPKGASPPSSRSSEKERAEPSEDKKNTKRSKLDRIQIDREELLPLDREALPPDAEFKGYEDVVVQDLVFRTDNVKFRKEKYYSASMGKTFLAPLPQGYGGEFGPNLKSLCMVYSQLCNMTEPKIADLLANMGILISDGQISNLPAQELKAHFRNGNEQLQAEKEAIVEAGLSSSPWQHIDDTGTPVNGLNRHCHVLCNPLYTAYWRKS